jgi:glycosyltransferase involved in cell wall biosynthesis
MRVLMLVWTGVATDTRVLREASALVDAGHTVHIIGRGVPADFVPPAGVSTDSAGAPPLAQGRTRRLSAPERVVRWALLPVHVGRRLRRWTVQARGLALQWAAAHGAPDVVHAHDFTTLELADELASRWGVPFVYDTHEYWRGRPTEGRPHPVRAWRERRVEAEVAARAAAVITVGPGVAGALRRDHPHWPEIAVVRNTFPERPDASPVASPPAGAVYAGRLARDRELETIAAASRRTSLPITLMGPADDSWLAGFDRGRCAVLPAGTLEEVDRRLTAAGIALVTHSDAWDNHRLALPNKLFHALSLGVPVVATAVGELAEVVRGYECGALYRPGDAEDLARAIDEVRQRHEHYLAMVRAARHDASWSRDRAVLLGVYAGVLPERAAGNSAVPGSRRTKERSMGADGSEHDS